MIGWSRWTLRHQNFLGKNLCLIPEKRADRQREKAIPEKMCGKNLRYGMLLYEEARKKTNETFGNRRKQNSCNRTFSNSDNAGVIGIATGTEVYKTVAVKLGSK